MYKLNSPWWRGRTWSETPTSGTSTGTVQCTAYSLFYKNRHNCYCIFSNCFVYWSDILVCTVWCCWECALCRCSYPGVKAFNLISSYHTTKWVKFNVRKEQIIYNVSATEKIEIRESSLKWGWDVFMYFQYLGYYIIFNRDELYCLLKIPVCQKQ